MRSETEPQLTFPVLDCVFCVFVPSEERSRKAAYQPRGIISSLLYQKLCQGSGNSQALLANLAPSVQGNSLHALAIGGQRRELFFLFAFKKVFRFDPQI